MDPLRSLLLESKLLLLLILDYFLDDLLLLSVVIPKLSIWIVGGGTVVDNFKALLNLGRSCVPLFKPDRFFIGLNSLLEELLHLHFII